MRKLFSTVTLIYTGCVLGCCLLFISYYKKSAAQPQTTCSMPSTPAQEGKLLLQSLSQHFVSSVSSY